MVPKTSNSTYYTVYMDDVPSPTSDLIWFIILAVGR